jgi:1,4-dihydroxy-2-naphthoyl-CoA hydrolase
VNLVNAHPKQGREVLIPLRPPLGEQPQDRLLIVGQRHRLGSLLGSEAVKDDASVKPAHFDDLIGTEWLSDDPDDARVRVEIRDELRQPFGLMHGGVMSSLIESVCSRATFGAVYDDGMAAMGQSIEVSFIRPITKGGAEVRAKARHRGRTTWLWQAEVLNDEGKACALAKMTIAVRPRPET